MNSARRELANMAVIYRFEWDLAVRREVMDEGV